MVSLTFFFLFFVLIFALIGSMRGWAKELLVTFSVILATFIIYILETLIPELLLSLTQSGMQAYFWLRAGVLILLVFFGYQTPNIPKLGGAKFARERLQDTLLGFFLGALNGFLVVGTLWYYMDTAGYPFKSLIIPPSDANEFTRSAMRLVPLLAPNWLRGTVLFVIIAVAFVFVLVVLV